MRTWDYTPFVAAERKATWGLASGIVLVLLVLLALMLAAPATAQSAKAPTIEIRWEPMTLSPAAAQTQNLAATLGCFESPLLVPAGPATMHWAFEVETFPGFTVAPIADQEDLGSQFVEPCYGATVPVTISVARDTPPGTYLMPMRVMATPLPGSQIAAIETQTVLHLRVLAFTDWNIALDHRDRPVVQNAGNVPLALQVLVTDAQGQFDAYPVAVPVGETVDLKAVGVKWGDDPVTISAVSLHEKQGDGSARVLQFTPPAPRINLLPGIVAIGAMAMLLIAAIYVRRSRRT